jgi:hypothetical protein
LKVAVFYEGACEEEMLKAFFRACCPSLILLEDPLDFQTCPQDCALLYNCEGYQNVFLKAAAYEYIYANDHGLVVRDLEDAACFSVVKAEALSSCARIAHVHTMLKATLFAKPDLEAIYSADPDLFSTVMQQFYKETFGVSIPPQAYISDINNFNFAQGNAALKSLTKKHNISWNKLRMAKKFFKQMDFLGSSDPYFTRLRAIFSFCAVEAAAPAPTPAIPASAR